MKLKRAVAMDINLSSIARSVVATLACLDRSNVRFA